MGTIKFAQLIQQYLPNWQPKTLFDIGTYDGTDAIKLANEFPEATIYAFEAYPVALPLARQNTAPLPQIHVVPLAVGEVDGPAVFYTNSLLRSSHKYDYIEVMPTTEFIVPCTRLDSFMRNAELKTVDALWLDAQGAELMILKSLGDTINSVRAIWTEFAYDEIYIGQPLLKDLIEFLALHGLTFLWKQDVQYDGDGLCWWGDAFFARI